MTEDNSINNMLNLSGSSSPKLSWIYTTGDVISSSPTISDGVIYFVVFTRFRRVFNLGNYLIINSLTNSLSRVYKPLASFILNSKMVAKSAFA